MSTLGAVTPVSAVREALLDAAYDAVLAGDWDRARMADVARAAGVSRQTLYNEFGSKDGLAEAMAWRQTERFLAEVDRALDDEANPDAAASVAAAVRRTLELAHDDPLIKAVLTSARDAQLLPFLTTRAEPLLDAARDRFVRRVTTYWPDLSLREVRTVAEIVVRLTVSHVVLPTEPPETTAATAALIVTKMLTLHASGPETPTEGRA